LVSLESIFLALSSYIGFNNLHAFSKFSATT